MVNNPFLTIVLGDFNAKLSLWYNNNITTYGSSKVDGVTSQFGLEKIIKEPTHIIGDSSWCIDLIFTNQPNFVMEYGVHSSFHSNCHHHITLAKQNSFLKSIIPILMNGNSGIIKRLMLTKLDKQ